MMQKQKGSFAGVIVPVLSIILALLIGCIIIFCLGANPFVALQSLAVGAFGSKANIGTTLTKATPLIFTALCACFAYKCGVFNLGGEGQFIMGSVAAIYVTLTTGITGVPAIILALIAGAAAGGFWGFLPGILKITRGQNEMIISIMFNYIATLFMGVVYTNWLRDGSVPQTGAVPKESQLPRLIPGMRMTWGFVIAVVVGICIAYFLYRTSPGFKLRAVGINATAAKFNGFPVKRYLLMSFIVSGAIAGLGGSAEILGTQFRLINGYAAGYGFDGVHGAHRPAESHCHHVCRAALRGSPRRSDDDAGGHRGTDQRIRHYSGAGDRIHSGRHGSDKASGIYRHAPKTRKALR